MSEAYKPIEATKLSATTPPPPSTTYTMGFLKRFTSCISLQSIFSRGVKRHIPDDIIVEILSRLPSKHVVKCRVVCKLWLALTLSPYFVDLHLKRFVQRPVQLVQIFPGTERMFDLFMLDDDNEEEVTRPNQVLVKKLSDNGVSKTANGERLRITVSGFGLVVLRHMTCGTRYDVWNPLTKERVTVNAPLPIACSQVHAIFFHQPTQEYRMLLSCGRPPEFYQLDFYVYSLNKKLWRKLPSCSCCLRHIPEYMSNPVVSNGGVTLYWMTARCYRGVDRVAPCTSTIIEFDTQKEELRLRPHPGNECSSLLWHRRMCVFEARDGALGVCSMVVSTSPVVAMWVLEDYGNWSWTKRNSIDLSYAFPEWGKSLKSLISITIDNNHRLLVQFFEKLCFVDLDDDGKKRKIVKVIDKSTIIGKLQNPAMVPLSYTKSVVSLYQMS